MPNYGLPGIKRMSLKEHLNNTNMLEGQSNADGAYQPFTLNKIRTANAFRANPDEYRFNPYQENVSGQPEMETAPSAATPVMRETVDTGLIPGQVPGKAFNMAAVNIPEVAKESEAPGMMEYWKKPVMGNIPLDQFVTLAGTLAHAIAPDTAQGRAGAGLAKMAGPVYQERMKREYEAPEKKLARRLTEAKIADLEKGDTPKTAMSWFLESNPGATKEDVATFKKSLEIETKGSYWRTVDDEGRVSIYKGGSLIHTSEPGVGKTKAAETMVKTAEGYVPSSKAEGKMPYDAEKKPSPVTWTTATKELKGRFGKQDAIGNIVITPELQHSHRVAQKKLVKLKASGVAPLDAINQAEDFARHIEDRYFEYIEAAGKDKNNMEKVKKAFKQKYGYVPRVKR